MAYAQAKTVDTDLIPVIDITALRDGSDLLSAAQALHRASREIGFIYVIGHGISDEVIASARKVAYAFFRGPLEVKQGVKVNESHRGFLGRGGSKMDDDAKADLKESFIWGSQEAEGQSPRDHVLRGPNQWPAAVPGMQAAAMAYFYKVHDVAHHLMRGFALGLELPEDFFLRTADRPLSRASFVYYPTQVEEIGEDQFGVGPHTDFGVLTVLCQDDVGGLQVQSLDGEWIHAPPIEGALVVNVGDLLARWTNGAYRSTPHRVVNTSGRERLSLVLAFDPNPETLVDARQVFPETTNITDDPITCGDYLIWRFERAFSYRKEGA